MASLVRSSTTVRLPRQRDNSKSSLRTPRGMRARSSSFTTGSNSVTTNKQFTNGLYPTATNSSHQLKHRHGRQPSLESSSSSAGQNHLQPIHIDHSNTTTGSLLTVDGDIHASAASSVDTLSDDDDDEDDHDEEEETCSPFQQRSKLAALAPPSRPIPPIPQQSPTLQPPAPMPRASVSRSISNAFKDKLTLTRKKSKFSLRKSHGNASSPVLYDDGSQTTYPPAPPRVKKLDRSTERDQYGFIKGSQWVSVEEQENFEKQYQPIVNRRQQKWRRLIGEHGGEWPLPSSKFKRFIRKGIPSDIRGQAWLHYSGGETKKFANPGVYRGYVERAEAMGLENEFLDIIERDLHRTFPDNIRFKSTPTTSNGKGREEDNQTSESSSSRSGSVDYNGRSNDVPAIQALRRILSAFSLYAPEIGYCQSLNYIAGLLILFMDEEDAFWTFVVLIQDILPPNIYDVTMEGANIDQTVLMMLLSERCPHIWNRMSSGKSFWECEEADGNGMPTTTLVTSHWFLTLFINILPTESVLRVWDCIF
ncbi:rab-GTPase-TBC domain-containing protein [Phascolomyces articulosus]|uniref:Rab-GTPase-TBC domain-containing protein n=1 Tax=Phascolomyces articulosus TaxID=60185 RepID=A0AAD5P791_9FUNG|nr:rab-GTPase-TBC domain-containing protein [Phascolomyces articulosus]